MKKMKTLVALCLIVCICLSSMVMFASAADINSVQSLHILQCSTDGTRVRRTPKELGDDNVLGLLYRYDEFHTYTDLSETWYYGTPGPATLYYQKLGNLPGYVRSYLFYTA